MMEATLHFAVDVVLDEYDEHWSAVADQLGLVVHGDSEDDVRTRFRQALDELLDTFDADVDKVRRYLDHHQVESTVTMRGPQIEAPPQRQQYRERWQREFAQSA